MAAIIRPSLVLIEYNLEDVEQGGRSRFREGVKLGSLVSFEMRLQNLLS